MSRTVFSVAGVSFSWRDVIDAAVLRGDWARLEAETRHRLAVADAVRESGNQAAFDLGAATEEFRYARNLITADEAEAWLERAALSLEDWAGYLERTALATDGARQRHLVLSHGASDEDVAASTYVDAVCSGALDRCANTLAERAAVCARTAVLNLVVPSGEQARREFLSRLEHAFQDYVAGAITEASVQASIDARQLEWMQVDLRSLAFPTIEGAREAAMCIRHEQDPLETVGARAGLIVAAARRFVDEIDAPLRAEVVSARPGDAIGPIPSANGFTIAVLDRKIPVAEGGAALRRRAEAQVIADVVANSLPYVRWHARA